MRVEVNGVTVRYGENTAVDDLSFTLEGNRIFGLFGRNGAGKTSLMSVIAGYRKATKGEVLLDGLPVWENGKAMSSTVLVRHTSDAADKGQKIRDALDFARSLRDSWDVEYAAELMELFGLSPKQKIGELSLGQRSAFGITIGLASRAPLTMLDESHLGMDTPTRYKFYDTLLADFMKNPRTIIVSTHLIEELAALLEEVVIIDGGRLVLREETDSLRARGIEVTGVADDVDRFVAGLTVLSEKTLGRTKSATVYGSLDDAQLAEARRQGLELGPIALQDLFVHLTEPVGEAR